MTSSPQPFKCDVWAVLNKHSPDAAQYFHALFYHAQRQHYNFMLEMSDVNTFWRTQLALLGPQTMRVRLSLMDGISRASWLELFERDVVPTIVNEWVARIQSPQQF